MKYLILDYETRSEAPLKHTGAYEYARHKSTEILCVAWKLIDGEKAHKTKSYSYFLPSKPHEFLDYLADPEIKLVAHNAFFEQVITRFVLAKQFPKNPYLANIPIERWTCTASMAAALALPRKLEGACIALDLPVQKDMEGHKLMLKMSKPRKPTKKNPAIWNEDPEQLKRLVQYCETDVEAEYLLFKKLPPLIPQERKVWLLDQKMNWRGFHVDRKLVGAALKLIEEEQKKLNRELEELTLGTIDSVGQQKEVLSFLRSEGCTIPNLQAMTVKDTLETGGLTPAAKRMLELRQAGSKTSTAKYAAIELRSRTDSRIRDFQMYHGASTGRDTGMGIQPHNFPRGSIKDTDLLADTVLDQDLELLRMMYGNPLSALSSALRPVITATPGDEMFAEDFSAIEARVILWIAGDEPGLQVYRDGKDAYIVMASRIYKVPTEKVTKAMRDLGKRTELGCGFGMGWERFQETCKEFGDESVDADLAKTSVNTYREVHKPVVNMWYNLERAAIYAVQNPNKKITVNKTKWFMEGKVLFCELPSTRRLAYYNPEIKFEKTSWGEMRPKLYFWAVHPTTKKWALEGTWGGKLTENVVQAIARDFMVEARLRIEAAGYKVLLSIHDEILAERKKGEGSQAEYNRLMRVVPEWGKGCPIKTEGWVGIRYHK